MNKECISCGSINFQIFYEGKIREGKFGALTEAEHTVLYCTSCGLGFLKTFPDVDYIGSGYRSDYNKSSDIGNYFIEHDHEQVGRLDLIGQHNLRDKDVLDFGAGGGAFCDAVRGPARTVSCVELNVEFSRSLLDRGYEVYSDIDDLREDSFDIITLFGVIEHLSDPLSVLKKLYAALRPGGKLYVETDNLNDIIMLYRNDIIDQFYFRTVHNWYFTPKSLENVIRKTGFSSVTPNYIHKFGLSNLLQWLSNSMPTGLKNVDGFPGYLDAAWKHYLIENKKAELMIFEGVK